MSKREELEIELRGQAGSGEHRPKPEQLAESIPLADQIAHIEFCAEQAKNLSYAERAMELAVLNSLRSLSAENATLREQRDAMQASLATAVDLYENYGLVAGPRYGEPGKWINEARLLLYRKGP